ncbi:hypothetical protein ACK8HX_17295 [Oryzobacter sp. R7]|uniref:PPE domain-containing protein n=1 Tax=Oryzobacter faecalis TaxID=3388656 RepID=UPI00398CCCBE
MVQAHDGGGGPPALPEGAGPYERALHEIYDFQAGIVDHTAEQWRTTSEEMGDLAADVRRVVRELQRAPDVGEVWDGPAAAAAYDALGKLASNLDRHAEDIKAIEGGLTAASDAVAVARTAYVLNVRPIDIDLDQGDYMRTPVRPLGGSYPDGQVPDTEAYAAALAEAKRLREAEAKKVLDAYEGQMQTATRKLPVEPAESPVNTRTPGGGGGSGGTPVGGGSSGGTYVGPAGGRDDGGGRGGEVEPPPTFDPPTVICIGLPEVPEPEPVDPDPVRPDPVVVDGPGGGSLGPAGGGAVSGTTGQGGSAGQSGLGSGGMAAGIGGMAAGGGAAALLGRGGPGAAGAGRPGAAGAGRPGVMGVTNSGAAARGSGAAGRAAAGGAGGAGRSTVVAAGGQSAAGRGAAGGRGGGGARAGRYGVPQLGDRGGRGGVVAAAGTAGSRGGKGEDRDEHDLDRLTHEDEETWFEGADDATPPVWE